mmetsp:Transcript_14069/g.21966  ORF Transcript_14069/g.21966 Transcript_14069/m.21966 type:complete len:371 (-) Transcript_14069:83-1195(-)|eukprot:CAMPEP_0195293842 /NCGR_PEP_ID=MMETSP0707-20130614/13506_1 /TAXON_ID=33640 /ORGANISM="Asterionellopsis glacialis, Strain CCMP134" /LENGTH=370 /DNA_ID=CAMNT_0040354647 /DNA_START=98 /DNA_END=1210 /DNA_ORIENTATION=-
MGFQQAILLTTVTASQYAIIGASSLSTSTTPSVEPISDVAVGEQLSVGVSLDPLLLSQSETFPNAPDMESLIVNDDNTTVTSSFTSTTVNATASTTAIVQDEDEDDTFDHDFTKCPNPRDDNTMLPIWGPSAYELLQSKYRQVVGEKLSSITKVTEDGDSSRYSSKSGVLVPVEIRKSPGKGRGVHALTRIPKGTKVWDPQQHAIFYYEDDFLEFLSLLPFQLACDVLVWAYVEENCPEDPDTIAELEKEGFDEDEDECIFVVAVELDESSTFNSIAQINFHKKKIPQIPGLSSCKDLIRQSQIDGTTTGVYDDRVEQCNMKDPSDAYYAMRDIEAGQELLIDYGTMNEDEDLVWFEDLTDSAGFDHPYV